MSAERLREAARMLRGHIDGLTTDRTRWDDAFPASRVYADKSTYERLIVHPGVGLALADWLDGTRCAYQCGDDGKRFPYCSACEDSTYDHECPPRVPCNHSGSMRRALVVADKILGDAP